MTIYTRDLQAAHQRVQTARRTQPFDQAAYDAAYSDYLALIQAWAQEGRETANDAREHIDQADRE